MMRAVDLDDDVGLPLVFSIRIECLCTAGAMCETTVDKCELKQQSWLVECGAHGNCVDGSCVCESAAYSGDRCQNFDQCYGVNCGAHGSCVDGRCECTDRYSGETCTVAPKPCCTSACSCCSNCNGCPTYYCVCGDCWQPGWSGFCDPSC
jgi:hypothetical protein